MLAYIVIGSAASVNDVTRSNVPLHGEGIEVLADARYVDTYNHDVAKD